MNTVNYLKKLFLSFTLVLGFTTNIFAADLWQLVTGGVLNTNDYVVELENSTPIKIQLPATIPFPTTVAKELEPGQKLSFELDFAGIQNWINAVDKEAFVPSANHRSEFSETRASKVTYNYKFSAPSPTNSSVIEETTVKVTLTLCFKSRCKIFSGDSCAKKGTVKMHFSTLPPKTKSDL